MHYDINAYKNASENKRGELLIDKKISINNAIGCNVTDRQVFAP